jgi:hypothetical protein
MGRRGRAEQGRHGQDHADHEGGQALARRLETRSARRGGARQDAS